MTIDQWLELEAYIASEWQNARQQPAKQVQLRYLTVKDTPYDQALNYLVQLARTGSREFPPTPGQIHAGAVAGGRDAAPAPGTVIGLLCRAAGTYGRDREADALRWMADQPGGLHAARFAVEHGWRQFCMEGLDDPEYGGAVRQRIEKSAAASVSGLEREYREGRVLPMVGRRLQQLDAGAEARGLRHLNPLDALIERPALDAGTTTTEGATR